MSQERLSLADILNMYDNSAATQANELPQEEAPVATVESDVPQPPESLDESPVLDVPPDEVSTDLPLTAEPHPLDDESETLASEAVLPQETEPMADLPEMDITMPEGDALPPEWPERPDIISALTASLPPEPVVEEPYQPEVPSPASETYQNYDWSTPSVNLAEVSAYQNSAQELNEMENQPNIPPHLIVTAQGDYDLSQPEGVQDLHQEILDVLGEVETIMARLQKTWNAKDQVKSTYAELEKAAKNDASSSEIIKLAEKIAKLGDSGKLDTPSRQELSGMVMKLEGVRAILARYVDMFWHS